jgi:histidinol-phosphate aminotransferase
MIRPVARLHLSESVYGVSPAALRAYHDHASLLSLYPDPRRDDVTQAIAQHLGLPPEAVLVANGSDELVLLSALALGRRDRPGVTTSGTFPGYRVCLEEVGRGAVEVPAPRGRLDVAAFAAALQDAGVGYVCNPHNPSGRALTGEELAGAVAAARSAGTAVVFDEAYLDFAPAGTPSVRDHLEDGPVLGLRTFSKAWGLAALRIGYVFGDPSLLAAIRRAQGTMPFSSNGIAQAVVLAALGDPGFVQDVRRRNQQRVGWFEGRLDGAGLRHLPSCTNFVAVAVGDSAAAEAALARRGVLTRDAGAFGMPGYLRVSMGGEEELLRLVADVTELGLGDVAHAAVTSSPRQ